MLSNDQLYVLNLLRESLGLPFEDTKPENIKYISSVIRRSGIVLTVYMTIKARGQHAEALEKDLRAYYYATLKQSANQEYEGENILKALSEAGLNCIGLKGWELRNFYPKKYMRQMADLDILVRPYQLVSFGKMFTPLLQQTYWPDDAAKMRKTLSLLSKMKGKVRFYKYRFNNFKEDAFDVSYKALTGKSVIL